MPWNSQGGGGGGPWGPPPGGGGQNPWSRGSGGGGSRPPDIEDLVRRSQERLKGFVPSGPGSRFGIWAAVAAALVIWLLFFCTYRVQPDEQGVVTRFGAYVRTEPPGLTFIPLYPIETLTRLPVTRVNRITVGYRSDDNRRGERDVADESLMLTGDENIIDIDFSVFWVIKNAGDYLFKVRDPAGTVKKAAESAMREVIGRTELQPALTEARQQIEQQTRELLQNIMDEFQSGVEITQVQLQRADPPAPVIDAFNDVQRARSDRERLRNEAEAYRNDIIPRARGDAERLIQEASAYREQVLALAHGDADRFRKVLEGYRLAKDVLGQRMYLETMEEVLKGAHKVIIDEQAQGASGVVPYLPLGELINKPVAPPPPPAPTTAPRGTP